MFFRFCMLQIIIVLLFTNLTFATRRSWHQKLLYFFILIFFYFILRLLQLKLKFLKVLLRVSSIISQINAKHKGRGKVPIIIIEYSVAFVAPKVFLRLLCLLDIFLKRRQNFLLLFVEIDNNSVDVAAFKKLSHNESRVI